MFFLEEQEGQRINHNRVDEIVRAGSATLLTACPFCKTMLKDGLVDQGQAESIAVLDVAEYLAGTLAPASESNVR